MQQRSRRRARGWWATPLVAAGLVLTACGGGAAPAAKAPAGQTTTSKQPAATGAAPATAAAKQALQNVTIALSNASSSNAGIYVANALGYFTQEGIKLHFIHIGGGASAIAPALATNRVDVADVGVNPAAFNAIASVKGIKMVADKGSTPKGFGFTSIEVRKDLASKIKGPADFKGISIAMTPPGLGTANGYMLSTYLKRAGLTPSDLHIQPIAFPLQIAALQKKAVDAAIMAEPWASEAVREGLTVRLATNDQVVPNQQIAALAYSAQFIQQRKALADKFMVAYVKGIRTYDNAFVKGNNKTEIINILTKQTAIHSAKLWAEMIPAGLNPDGKLNEQSIQQSEDFFHKIGVVHKLVPVSQLVDNSFVDYADKQLGPAQ